LCFHTVSYLIGLLLPEEKTKKQAVQTIIIFIFMENNGSKDYKITVSVYEFKDKN